MLNKLLEIQYLKGRLDELYKGYVPTNMGHDNRVVDSRISKYENKLKEKDIQKITDEHIEIIEKLVESKEKEIIKI